MQKRELPKLCCIKQFTKKLTRKRIQYRIKILRAMNSFKILILRGIIYSLGFRIGWYLIEFTERHT